MTEKEHVRKYGGKFNIQEGFSWIQSTDLDVRLVLTPGKGSGNVGITSAYHSPGMAFEPHVHPLSEEILIAHKGRGEMYLYDRWIPVEEGDVVYAPPGVYHGTRNPAENTEGFYTIGIATPPQLELYQRVGYDVLADGGQAYRERNEERDPGEDERESVKRGE